MSSKLRSRESAFTVLCSAFTVLCSPVTVLGSAFTVLCSAFTVLGSAFTVLGSAFTVLCSAFTVLGSHAVRSSVGDRRSDMKKSGADAVNGILSINRIRLTRINMFILCIYECTRKFQKARLHIPGAQPV